MTRKPEADTGLSLSLPPHRDDVQAAWDLVRQAAATHQLHAEIMKLDLAPQGIHDRTGDSECRLHDDSATPRLLAIIQQLEGRLAELDRIDMWTDSSEWDNSYKGTMIVVFNVMRCEPPFDRYGRPRYVGTDPYVAILHEDVPS